MVRILIIEDDELAAKTIVRVLERAGHEVRREASGASALAVATEWRPSCAIVDRRLPDADGLAIARDLRRSFNTRVVVLSGDPATGKEAEDVDAYLLKPVDARVLLAAVGTE